ncbi:hypothetical protein OG394_16220 [Kribbella sp. NBC_01245]|uniref:hypothetical protein n=1 Tax=Kribbella sp. NBC_01245 TaxID=2903578 RepID=UPI002E29D59E|nr:hypothetical protein [Kribbella sp. NBC_01245]
MRKSILAAATALTVVAAGLVTGVVVTARPATAALSDVPADCSVYTTAYRSDGQRLTYSYSARKTGTQAISGDKLGWVPSAVVTFLESGGADSRAASSLVAHPTDGNVYLLKRVVTRTDGVWKVTEHKLTRVKSGFAGTRHLEMAWPYVYRVAGTSLYRYKFAFSDGQPTMSAPVKLSGVGWDTVRTLAYQRTAGTGSTAVDVLLGTKANGELKEWRINYATPARITPKVLRTSGWASLASLNTGWCDSHPNGRPLLGITAAGRASIHFDANKTDGVGTDIKGGSLGLVGWTAEAY